MSNVVTGVDAKKNIVKSKFTEEFEQYLKRQCMRTTFNGLELDKFNWIRKIYSLK